MLEAAPADRRRKAGCRNQLAQEKPREVREEVSMHSQGNSET